MATPKPTLPSFDDLATIEPRLRELERFGKRQVRKRGKPYCANEVWYRMMKPHLVRLVGFQAANEKLRTTVAYDVAYDYLYQLLPDCRDCLCWQL